ncbi:MAG TPA: metallophosphoesterase family protein [Longimicrobiaceae bacterium]|nr:metallophosphoesterase family protein [Longimicrobiaceae bacterium]
MRIAVMTDVHANLPALRAALAEIRKLGVDAVYHTGDVIGIGPQPAEVMEVLLGEPDVRLLMGNHDEWFATGLPEPRPPWMTTGERRHIAWVHEQLDPALRAAVGAWPYEAEERVGAQRVKLLHYPLEGGGFARPRDLRGSAEAEALFPGEAGEIVFYGHHHPFSDLQGRARYVNPGSLGCSREAVARFAVLEAGDPYRLTFHAVPYDPAPLVAEFRRKGVPEAEFILRNFMPGG